jgi:hypothetical protein
MYSFGVPYMYIYYIYIWIRPKVYTSTISIIQVSFKPLCARRYDDSGDTDSEPATGNPTMVGGGVRVVSDSWDPPKNCNKCY